jgi:hypothetical protein
MLPPAQETVRKAAAENKNDQNKSIYKVVAVGHCLLIDAEKL